MRKPNLTSSLPFKTSVYVPFQAHSQTSLDAALDMGPRTSETLQTRVYNYLQENGPATDIQIQVGLGMDGSTERPRRIELFNQGRIVDHGVHRQLNGRNATVWAVA